MRRSSNRCLNFVLALTSFLTIKTFSESADTLNASQTIRDGDSLISSDGTFELGFFRPDNSTNRTYVGIWYRRIPAFTVVWVSNRDHPLTNTNSSRGVLKLSEDGILSIVDSGDVIVWSSNSSRVARNPVVQLLDSGNLVVKDDSSDEYLWQSFDYPTDTILPGMKFGKNLETGHESSITAWKSSDDPGTGDYSYHLEPAGYPQTVLRKSSVEIFRAGPWNGAGFSGTPGLKVNSIYTFQLVIDEKEVYYKYQLLNKSVVSRFVMNQSGAAQRWTWVDRTQDWVLYLTYPTDNCDAFRLCGVYGNCNVATSPICGCLAKFVPRFSDEWAGADWSNGCVRRSPLDCKTDGFVKYNDIKLPDTVHSWFNSNMSLKECRKTCLENCSCMAYSTLDIRNGGSGCLLWLEDLADIKVVYGAGQDIYVRVASSELGSRRKNRSLLVGGLTSLMGMILLGVSFFVYTWKKKMYLKLQKEGLHRESDNNDMDLPSFHLTTISKATNNFSLLNKLGEGGFGPVYKGTLEDGREIAVKRLSKTSMQGVDEFKNEVLFIAKLQHRNLVKLLGCCIQGEEKMLVYEYMPNKSLDLILFNEMTTTLLDWPTRFQIINGIARGLMYLHQDSRLRIIHRDLKASNILLDADMNPKISDFGLARMFRENEFEANTSRIVGTYGYISPEFAIDGTFSVKSDVFSFGVIMLEILSSKRNRGYSHTDHRHNLVGHAWLLYKEGRSLELVNISGDKEELRTCSDISRCVHVGLLCVQRYPEDRPNMSSVVFMLENKQVLLPQAKEPGFFTERGVFGSDASTSTKATSTNEITITMLEAR